jgi:two-component system chemotaxis response regulator CheB
VALGKVFDARRAGACGAHCSLERGVAVLPSEQQHQRLADDRRLRLSSDAPLGGLRPRADLTIVDAAKRFGSALLLVVLTGMGRDGAAGLKVIRDAGGQAIVQDRETSIIYGMPQAALAAAGADRVAPLAGVAPAVVELIAHRRAAV